MKPTGELPDRAALVLAQAATTDAWVSVYLEFTRIFDVHGRSFPGPEVRARLVTGRQAGPCADVREPFQRLLETHPEAATEINEAIDHARVLMNRSSPGWQPGTSINSAGNAEPGPAVDTSNWHDRFKR